MITEQATAGRPPRLGRQLYEGHHAWPTMLAIKLGIAYSVSRASAEPIRELGLSDFMQQVKRKFPPAGSRHTPRHSGEDFVFKDYAPAAFRQLREHFGVSAADYALSIAGEHPLRELGNPGKSGSCFYLTHDSRYLIKTVSKKECKFLRAALPNYYTYIVTNDSTMLPRFFGLIRLSLPKGDKQRLVLMNNLLPERYRYERYDLKGSSLGRAATAKERNDPLGVRKDRDFDQRLRVPEDLLEVLTEQLSRDSAWLEKLHVMDYSLLVGLNWPNRAEDAAVRACADLDPSGPDTDDEPWDEARTLTAEAVRTHGSAAAAIAALEGEHVGVGFYRVGGPGAFAPEADLWRRQRPWQDANAATELATGAYGRNGDDGGGDGGDGDGAGVRTNEANGRRPSDDARAGAAQHARDDARTDASDDGDDDDDDDDDGDGGGESPRAGARGSGARGAWRSDAHLRERPATVGPLLRAGAGAGAAPSLTRATRGSSLGTRSASALAQRHGSTLDCVSDTDSDEGAPIGLGGGTGGIPALFRPISSASAPALGAGGSSHGGPHGPLSGDGALRPRKGSSGSGKASGGKAGVASFSISRGMGIGGKASAPVEVPQPTPAELRTAFLACQQSLARRAALVRRVGRPGAADGEGGGDARVGASARTGTGIGSGDTPPTGSPRARRLSRSQGKGAPRGRDVSIFQSDDGGFRCVNGKGEAVRVYCGIIDILQQYTKFKQMEHAYKAARWFSEKDGISVVSPDKYALRFRAFIISKFAPLTAPAPSATGTAAHLLTTVPAAAAAALGRAAAALGEDGHTLVRRTTATRADFDAALATVARELAETQAHAQSRARQAPKGFSVEGVTPNDSRSEAKLVHRRGDAERDGSASSGDDNRDLDTLERSRASSRTLSDGDVDRAVAAAASFSTGATKHVLAMRRTGGLRGTAAVQWAHNYHVSGDEGGAQ